MVDGHVDELHEEPDEPHDQETPSSRPNDFDEFFSVRFRAFLDKVHGVFVKLLQRLDDDGINVRHAFTASA